MPLFTFDHYQLTQLSLNSRSTPNDISPMNIINFAAIGEAKNNELVESKNDLVRLELLKEGMKGLFLAPELEPAFLIIHRPKKVWKFYREGLLDIGEDYFCWLAGAAVQVTTGPLYAYNIVTYPYTDELVLEWFESEFMKEVEIPNEGLIDQRLILTNNEMLLLTMMQMIYKNRYDQDGELKDKLIDINELFDFDYWDQMPESIDEDNLRFFRLHIRNGEETLKTIASLRIKGLLEVHGSKLRLSLIAQEIFSPSKLIDHMQFAEFSESPKLATLNVLTRGYVLTRPYQNTNNIVLDILHKETSKQKIFELMTNEVKVEEAIESVKESDVDVKYCQSCGSSVPIDAKFCKHCGNALNQEKKKMFCKNCGEELKEETVFCPSCGTRR